MYNLFFAKMDIFSLLCNRKGAFQTRFKGFQTRFQFFAYFESPIFAYFESVKQKVFHFPFFLFQIDSNLISLTIIFSGLIVTFSSKGLIFIV